jgi:hypothetical protein
MIINKLGIPVIYNYHGHLISNNHIYKEIGADYDFLSYSRFIRLKIFGIDIFIKDGRK